MASTDARPVPRKNVAFRYYFAIRKNDGTLITSWAGMDSEVDKDGAGFNDCTNEAAEISTSGYGYIDLTSTEMNADAVGLKVTVTNTDALPIVVTFFPEEVGDYRANVEQFGGTAGTFASGIPETKVASIAANAITAAAIASDAITDAKVASDVTIASVTGAVGSVTSGVTVTTNNDKTGYGLSSAAVQAIWDAATSALTTVGSIGKWILDKLDVVVSTRASQTSVDDLPTNAELATALASADDAVLAAVASLASSLTTIASYIDTEVAAIKAKTDNLPSDPADQSAVEAAVTAAQSALTTLINALPAAVGASEPLAGFSRDRLLRIAAAVGAGHFNGPAQGEAGTGVLKEVGTGSTAALVTASIDADANRTITAIGT